MNYHEYTDIGYKIKQKLCEDLNGSIRFLVHEREDCISIDISWHDFKYQRILVNVSKGIEAYGDTEFYVISACNDILEDYKEKVLNVYFKSEYKKQREKEKEKDFEYKYTYI